MEKTVSLQELEKLVVNFSKHKISPIYSPIRDKVSSAIINSSSVGTT